MFAWLSADSSTVTEPSVLNHQRDLRLRPEPERTQQPTPPDTQHNMKHHGNPVSRSQTVISPIFPQFVDDVDLNVVSRRVQPHHHGASLLRA